MILSGMVKDRLLTLYSKKGRSGMVKVILHNEYFLDLQQILLKLPEISQEVETKIKWFKRNPDDTRLLNHALRKRLKGKWAFSITDDIRIIYEWIGKNTVRFLAIGAHKKVYPGSAKTRLSS